MKLPDDTTLAFCVLGLAFIAHALSSLKALVQMRVLRYKLIKLRIKNQMTPAQKRIREIRKVINRRRK